MTGEHDRPEKYPFFIADAYFHTVDDLEDEIRESGFTIIESVAVEGSVWITPTLQEKWCIEDSRNRMLEIIRATERERTIMGMSPHFLTIGRK